MRKDDRTFILRFFGAFALAVALFSFGKSVGTQRTEERYEVIVRRTYEEAQTDALEGRWKYEKIDREDGSYTIMERNAPDVELAYYLEEK